MKKTMTKLITFITTICLVLAFPITSFAAGPHDPHRTYEEALAYYEKLQSSQVNIEFSQRALYTANESILYARKIVGVNPDGTFQIGPWECISHRSNVCYCEDKNITLPATYVSFAYSYDIMWGTDWPFSAMFWNSTKEPARNISILISGGVRTPDVLIYVNDRQIYHNDNCSAHNQWIPQ